MQAERTYGRAKSQRRGKPMPYSNISDLPKEQVDQYSLHQKHAFLEAFNNAYQEYGGDESRAFATAHAAAQRAPEREPEKGRERETSR
jgi:cation transport regulator